MSEVLTPADVMSCGELPSGSLEALFVGWGITVDWVDDGVEIPGSHWGDAEAGMIGETLYVRSDTPVHSALHEGGHLICMGPTRRQQVHTDAEGEELEECGVCVLQILLAERLPNVGSDRLMRDMDAWGYSFRLGSTRAWFEGDAEDAWQWLEEAGVVAGRALRPADPDTGAHRVSATDRASSVGNNAAQGIVG